MKSFNVKSNAKRFARGLAAKYPGLEVAEPQEVAPGAREWWPAVTMTMLLGPSALQELEAVAYVWSAGEVVDALLDSALGPAPEPADASGLKAAAMLAVAEAVDAGLDESGLKAAFDAIPPVGDIDFLASEGVRIEAHATHEELAQGKLTVDITMPATHPLAALAASLPPLAPSTPEEIAARRAERRARIDAEKAAGTRTATGERVKINKTQTILDLINRPDGATQAELEAATGWQRHTLRGFIAGTLRKRLAPVGRIECRRAKGGASVYVFVKGGAA